MSTYQAIVTDVEGGRHRFLVQNATGADAAREAVRLACRWQHRFVPRTILICIPGGNQ